MPKFSIDGVILIALVFFAYKGMKKGLVAEVFKLMGIFAGFLVAAKFFDVGQGWLAKEFGLSSNLAAAVSFMGLFILTALAARLVAGSVRKLLEFSMLGWLDKGGGALFGALKASMIVSSILLALSFMPGDFSKTIESKSSFAGPLKGLTPRVYDVMASVFPESQTFTEKLMKTIKGYAAKKGPAPGMPLKGLKDLEKLQGSDEQKKKIEDLLKKYGK